MIEFTGATESQNDFGVVIPTIREIAYNCDTLRFLIGVVYPYWSVSRIAICCTVCWKQSLLTDPYRAEDQTVNTKAILAWEPLAREELVWKLSLPWWTCFHQCQMCTSVQWEDCWCHFSWAWSTIICCCCTPQERRFSFLCSNHNYKLCKWFSEKWIFQFCAKYISMKYWHFIYHFEALFVCYTMSVSYSFLELPIKKLCNRGWHQFFIFRNTGFHWPPTPLICFLEEISYTHCIPLSWY